MTSRSHTRDTQVHFSISKPLHTKRKDGRRRKATTAGRKPSHTETSTAKKARTPRETKDLHAEEEQAASTEKEKRKPAIRTNYLKDKDVHDLFQSCIDGWDQKSDMEKDGCCAAFAFALRKYCTASPSTVFSRLCIAVGPSYVMGRSRAQRGPKAPTQ